MSPQDGSASSRPPSADEAAVFERLERLAATEGVAATLESLATSLAEGGRWHAVFDVRLLEARLSLGLPISGDLGGVDRATREKLDEASLAACREAGWPLLEEGRPAAAWMYLRASAEPTEVAARLEGLLHREDLVDREELRTEVMQLALWEGIDPALGLRLVIEDHGTCNAITAYMQAVARLPAARRRPAADVLVDHLHGECIERGSHVDLSHLHNVLEIGRECTDPQRIAKALALAGYARGMPEDLLMPGEPPFGELAIASEHFFGAQLGEDPEAAVAYFSAQVEQAPGDPGPLEWLAILLWRIGRAKESLRMVLSRQPGSEGFATGILPSIVDLAVAADDLPSVLDACRRWNDPVTFATALAAHQNFKRLQKP
jgi:hypothetical protein